MFAWFQILYSIFCILIEVSRSELSCRNEDNEVVDWFVALKPPNKYWFSYYLSQFNNSGWERSENITNDLNIFSVTLKQVNDSNSSKSFFAFYNDFPSKGHLKGIINFDKTSGYWIIHSVPNFPLGEKCEYPKSGIRNGQSFICISLNFDNLEKIVDQLLMMQPGVYHSNLPDKFSSNCQLMEKLKNLINNKTIKMNDSRILNFSTINQFKLFHFGKSPSFKKDLYSQFIAPKLLSSIKVQTWRGYLSSYCDSPYKVYNVKQCNLSGEIYNRTRDHSKWVVSVSNTKKIVCVGDINRNESQFKRGGGSLCVYHARLWSLFKDLVQDYERC